MEKVRYLQEIEGFNGIYEEGGKRYVIIYCTHVNGGCIVVPNYGVCCEAGDPDEESYNRERLETALPYGDDAERVARGVRLLWEIHEKKRGRRQ